MLMVVVFETKCAYYGDSVVRVLVLVLVLCLVLDRVVDRLLLRVIVLFQGVGVRLPPAKKL